MLIIRKKICRNLVLVFTVLALTVSLIPPAVSYAAATNKLTVDTTEHKAVGSATVELNCYFDKNTDYYDMYRAVQVNGKAGKFKRLETGCIDDYYVDGDVKAGKIYYYKAVLFDKNGDRISETNTVKCIVKLAKPYFTEAYTDMASGDPVLKWNKVSGADKYQIWRATSKKGTYKKVATTTKRNYKDIKASSGKKYYYKVKAVCSNNTAANSGYNDIKWVKAMKPDKKLAAAVKKIKTEKVSTLADAMCITSNKTDIRYLSDFDGGIHLGYEGKLKLSGLYDFSEIRKAGAAVKKTPLSIFDYYYSAMIVYPYKNGAKYKDIILESYGLNIQKVKKGSTEKERIKKIKGVVRKYYPSSKWTVTVKKYNSSSNAFNDEIKYGRVYYNKCLEECGYSKYKSDKYKYVLKIRNKSNSKKQGWCFVTVVPSL